MKRHSSYLAAFVGLLCLPCAPLGAANAQEPGQGVLNAVAFEPLPKGVAVLVRPLDDTDQNLAIKKEFEAALAAAGFSVAAEGPALVLSFESRDVIGAGPAPRPQTSFRLRDQEGRLSVRERGSVPKIIEAPRGGTQIYHPSRFRIDATVDDKDLGTRHWHGWAVADTEDRTRLSLATAMVPALVDSIGRTERQEPFPLK